MPIPTTETTNRGFTRAPTPDNRSLAQLIKELRDEATVLLRQEVALARAEFMHKLRVVLRNTVSIAAGGVVLFAGLIFLLAAATAGLQIGLVALGMEAIHSYWLAPLIVGLITAGIGYALLQKGISTLKDQDLTPHQTVDSMKANKQWLQHKVK